MKHLLFVAAALLACLEAQAGPKKETAADMSAAKNIFIGWVGVPADDWTTLGYSDKDAWAAVIDRNNQVFQQACRKALLGRQVTAAKSGTDEAAEGQDLQVQFADVLFDSNSYALHLSIHFLDPRSGKELASVPTRSYRGGHFSVDNCLRGALEKVAEKVGNEITLSR